MKEMKKRLLGSQLPASFLKLWRLTIKEGPCHGGSLSVHGPKSKLSLQLLDKGMKSYHSVSQALVTMEMQPTSLESLVYMGHRTRCRGDMHQKERRLWGRGLKPEKCRFAFTETGTTGRGGARGLGRQAPGHIPAPCWVWNTGYLPLCASASSLQDGDNTIYPLVVITLT